MNSTKLSAAEDFFKKESIPVGCISPAFPSSGACWEANLPYQCMPPSPVNRITYRCKNINLPQTGGQHDLFQFKNEFNFTKVKLLPIERTMNFQM